MSRVTKISLAWILILSITAGVIGLYVSRFVLASNLGQYSEVNDNASVSYVTAYSLPASVEGALNAQGITIRSSNTSNYSVDGNPGFMCISASRQSPNQTVGTVYRCVNTTVYDNSGDSYDSSHNTLRSLSGLTYSQIVYGCYTLGRNGGSSWAYAHAILSHLVGDDHSWFGPIASSYAYSALTTFAAAAASVGRGSSADYVFYVFVSSSGRQNLIALNYNSPPDTGHVCFRKIDQNNDPVIGAVITVTTNSGADVSGLRANIPYESISGGIRLVTTGVDVRIDGLLPGSSYCIYEESVPANSNYDLASPRSVSFVTDSSGNPSVAGISGWDASTYTYSMVDVSRPTGSVSFNKVGNDDGEIYDLKTAVITFSAYGHNVDFSSSGTVVVNDHTGTAERRTDCITFTTSSEGVDIEISNLPSGQYVFTETNTPEGYSTSNPIYVTISADGSVCPSSGNVIMTDYREEDSLEFGSISIRKEWTGGYGGTYTEDNFWSDVSNISFGMYYWQDWGSFEYQCITGPNAHVWDGHSAFVWGRVPEVGAGRSYNEGWVDQDTGLHYCDVAWDVAGHDPTISSLSEHFPARYWQYYSTYDQQNRWVDWPVINGTASASYMTCLPYGYYVVTEEWDEGIFMSDGIEEMYIDTENASGWHDMSYGSHKKYAMVFHITPEGTFVCGNWGSSAHTATLPSVSVNDGDIYASTYQTTYRAIVQNRENTGAVDVVKIDETGNGVSGVRFELWREGGGRIATGTIANPNSPSGVTSGNNNTYDVNWSYRTERQTGAWGNYEAITHSNASYVGDLRYGRYRILEYITDSDGNNDISHYRVPDGWEAGPLDSNGVPRYFQRYIDVTSADHETPQVVTLSNRELRLHIEVGKADGSTGTLISGYTGLNDATFELYADINANGVIDGEDRLIGEEADTDRDGIIIFDYRFDDPRLFPDIEDSGDYPVNYLIRETKAPEGYYINNDPSWVVANESCGYRASVSVADMPYVRLEATVYKFDGWNGCLLSGYTGNYDASFSLYADMNHDGRLDDSDVFLDTLADSDRDGVVKFDYVLTPELIASKFPMISSDDPLSYPTDYLVVEETAPFDYFRSDEVYALNLPAHQYSADASVYIEEEPYTARIRLHKIDAETGESVNSALFTIYTDVDGNGVYTEGVDTKATTFTDGNLTEAAFVWNQEENCYISSNLRSGRYIVVETGLPDGYFYVDSNGQPSLARNEVLIVIEGEDTSVEGFVPEVYESTVYNISPKIYTTLISPDTGTSIAPVGTDVELVDTVTYRNLVPGVEYVMTGTLMDKATGRALYDENGAAITSSTVFVPESPDGSVDVVFVLDTERLVNVTSNGDDASVRDIVAFEVLEFAASSGSYPQWYDGNPVATHEDINALGQTVRIGEIRTGVYDSSTHDQISSSGLATIIDNVHYEGLVPGVTYEVRGHLHLVDYDSNGARIDAGVIRPVSSEEILEPVTVFTPEDTEGYVEVVFKVDTERLRGRTMVAYEDLYQDGVHIMWHTDINDQAQTIVVPDVHTNAYGSDVNGDIVAYGQNARITDTVSYENLLVGRQYMVQGYLYWMYTDDNGNIHSGPVSDILGETEATATAVFTAELASGSVDVLFTFDSSVLAGLHYDKLVVMENLYNLSTMTRIAYHWDINDEAQSVYIPSVRTTAIDDSSGSKTITESRTATVTDRVYYSNLEPGREYTVVGSVQYAVTDENGNVTSTGTLVQNGEEVKAQQTFVPSSSSGYVDITFEIDGTSLSGIDKLVVFEDLYAGPGIRVATHADINDEEQTIHILRMYSSAGSLGGGRSVVPSDSVTLIDTVFYEGLTPGNEYRIETDIMNSVTGVSDAHRSTLFVPESVDGSIDISVTVDGSSYTSEKLVIFECLYDSKTGALIKAHTDWNDSEQSITFVPQTGIQYDPVYRITGCAILSFGAVFACGFIVINSRRKKHGH